jgi:PAS domain S-box-containing protein
MPPQKNNKSERTAKVNITVNRPQFSNAKEAIKESLVRQKGAIEIEDNPEIAIEVIDDQIKEHQPIEQALVAEHIFRKTIEESIAVGIAGFDQNMDQIYANRLFGKMVGWQPSELVGQRFPQAYWSTADAPTKRGDLHEEVKTKTQLDSFEYRFRHRHGHHFWGLVYCNDLADSSGNKIGRLIAVTNIDAQKNAEDVLRRLSAKLIGAQERERKNIAQNLHDGIGARLAGIKYGMEKIITARELKIDQLHDEIEDIIAAIRATIEETQRITKDLHPSILEDLGLLSAVRGYCREYGQLYSNINVHMELDLNEFAIPEHLKILVYRILQESLNNVAKHSHARNVKINLFSTSDELQMSVEDDGIGIDAKSIVKLFRDSKGMGLVGMRERAELFGGQFNLSPGVDGGLKVLIAWPLED